jgi:hypothetical protein
MLPVSLDCLFTLPLRYSLTCICPVSCVSYVASFSGFSFFITPSVFSNMYLSCVLCILCCQFLWIVFFLLPLRYSLTFICPVSCVPYVASFSGLSFFITPSVFSNIYLSCVLCILCCQFLWIVFFLLPLGYSLTCICPLSCVPYVASFSGLSFFITPSVFSNIYLSCALCTLCCQFLWIVFFFITPSVFSDIYLSCVLCTLCCQFLWIVLFYYPFGIL